MTSYEKIKRMNVEELAEFISGIYDEDENKVIREITIPAYNEDDIKEWLESECDVEC